MRIKICGITTPEAVDAVNTIEVIEAGGVDMAGFIIHPPSPRHLHELNAAALASKLNPQIERVLLTVDANDDTLDAAIAAINPHRLQLHGNESRARIEAIKTRTGLPIIKAYHINSHTDLEHVKSASPNDWMLFEAPPKSPDAPKGGRGESFDWAILKNYQSTSPWMLAGGLTPDNVKTAVRISGAQMVDVSSGVEASRGIKDPQKIKDFVAALRDDKKSK